jgi:hypothetical protein
VSFFYKMEKNEKSHLSLDFVRRQYATTAAAPATLLRFSRLARAVLGTSTPTANSTGMFPRPYQIRWCSGSAASFGCPWPFPSLKHEKMDSYTPRSAMALKASRFRKRPQALYALAGLGNDAVQNSYILYFCSWEMGSILLVSGLYLKINIV